MENWKEISKVIPPNNKVINTKIDDEHGVRNVQELKKVNNMWYLPDDSMYVYYTPTHWKEIEN